MVGFDTFDAGNDPFDERNFGAVDQGGVRYFWKIDYYDTDFEMGSADPANPHITCREPTVKRADEY